MHFRLCAGTALGVGLLALACAGPGPTDLAATGAALSRAPIESPLLAVIDDVNACNGLPITLTYSGTAQLQEFGDHSLLHINGTVTTTDGFTGTFTWTFVFQGDQVGHITAHDMEVSDVSGQRILFAVGLEHVTVVNGEIVVSLVHFSHDRIRCLGQPQA